MLGILLRLLVHEGDCEELVLFRLAAFLKSVLLLRLVLKSVFGV